jgi:peptidoglycan/LPS O-acetylase OafA/YrhL
MSHAGRTQATQDHGLLVTLEGLRGIAALCVVSYHLTTTRLIPSAYLSVDLFFSLSGFVITLRYFNVLRSGELTPGRFMIARFLRLYPLYLLGTVLGVASWFGGHYFGHNASRDQPFNLVAVFALFMAPNFSTGASYLYPLNIPAWSLLLELIANLLFSYNVMIWRRILPITILIAGLLLMIFSIDAGTLDFGAEWESFYHGLVRAVFGFSVGSWLCLAKERVQWVPKISPLLLCLMFFGILFCPYYSLFGWASSLIVLTVFPALIIVASRSEPSGLTSRVMVLLGKLSFPVYMLHVPIIAMLRQVSHLFHLGEGFVFVSAFPGVALASWTSLVIFDVPLRRRIKILSRT